MCYWNSLPCDVGLMAVDKVTLTPIHMGEIEEPTQSIDLSGSASQMPPGDDGESQSKASEQGTPPDEPTFFPAQRVFPSSLDHGYGSNSNNDNQSSICSTVCSELLDSVATIGPAKSTTKYRFIVAPSSCDEYAAPTTAGILGGPNELTALDHYCICECSSSECDCPEIRCFMCHKRPASEESSMHGKCKLPLPTVAHSARFANFPFIKANCVKKSDSPFGNVIYRSGALGDISSIQDWYGTRYPLYRLSDTCNLQDVGQNIKNLEERRVEIRPCDKREYLSCGDEQDGDPSICNAFKSPLSSSLTSFVSGKIHGTRNLRRCSHGKAPPTRLISSAGYFSSSGYSSSWHKHPAICLARGSTDLALPNADLRVLSSCSLLRKSSSLFGDQPQSHPASDSIAAKQPCRQGDASCPRQKRHVHSALRTDDRNAECRHFVSDDNGCPQYPKLSTRQCSKHRCLRQHPFNCGKRAKQGPAWKRNRSVPRPEYPLENGVSSTDDSLLNTQSPHSPGKTERRITRLLCTCQSESSQNHVAYPHDPPLYDKYDSAIDRRDVFDETTQHKPISRCLSFLGNDSGAETCGVDQSSASIRMVNSPLKSALSPPLVLGSPLVSSAAFTAFRWKANYRKTHSFNMPTERYAAEINSDSLGAIGGDCSFRIKDKYREEFVFKGSREDLDESGAPRHLGSPMPFKQGSRTSGLVCEAKCMGQIHQRLCRSSTDVRAIDEAASTAAVGLSVRQSAADRVPATCLSQSCSSAFGDNLLGCMRSGNGINRQLSDKQMETHRGCIDNYRDRSVCRQTPCKAAAAASAKETSSAGVLLLDGCAKQALALPLERWTSSRFSITSVQQCELQGGFNDDCHRHRRRVLSYCLSNGPSGGISEEQAGNQRIRRISSDIKQVERVRSHALTAEHINEDDDAVERSRVTGSLCHSMPDQPPTLPTMGEHALRSTPKSHRVEVLRHARRKSPPLRHAAAEGTREPGIVSNVAWTSCSIQRRPGYNSDSPSQSPFSDGYAPGSDSATSTTVPSSSSDEDGYRKCGRLPQGDCSNKKRPSIPAIRVIPCNNRSAFGGRREPTRKIKHRQLHAGTSRVKSRCPVAGSNPSHFRGDKPAVYRNAVRVTRKMPKNTVPNKTPAGQLKQTRRLVAGPSQPRFSRPQHRRILIGRKGTAAKQRIVRHARSIRSAYSSMSSCPRKRRNPTRLYRRHLVKRPIVCGTLYYCQGSEVCRQCEHKTPNRMLLRGSVFACSARNASSEPTENKHNKTIRVVRRISDRRSRRAQRQRRPRCLQHPLRKMSQMSNRRSAGVSSGVSGRGEMDWIRQSGGRVSSVNGGHVPAVDPAISKALVPLYPDHRWDNHTAIVQQIQRLLADNKAGVTSISHVAVCNSAMNDVSAAYKDANCRPVLLRGQQQVVKRDGTRRLALQHQSRYPQQVLHRRVHDLPHFEGNLAKRQEPAPCCWASSQTDSPLSTDNQLLHYLHRKQGSASVNPMQIDSDEDETTCCPAIKSPSGRFIRLEEIGRGAFKTVYRGLDSSDGVAVAWCELQDIYNRNERMRFREEVKLLKELQHPNIVRFFDHWVYNLQNHRKIVLVTELMTSGSLKTYLRKFTPELNSKKLKIIKSWCRQILQGLAYMHSRKPPVIHRDLKCDNIFISGTTGSVKIGDLGLAVFKTETFAKSMRGTVEFMAPEMFDELYDEMVDIYSFGLCMLEICTDDYPYMECRFPTAVMKKVLSGHRPDCFYKLKNESVRDIVECCIRRNKNQRLTANELLKHSFFMKNNGLVMERVCPNRKIVHGPISGFNDTRRNADVSSQATDDNKYVEFKLKIEDPTKRSQSLLGESDAIAFKFDLTSDNPSKICFELLENKIISDDDVPFINQSLFDKLRIINYERDDRREGGGQESMTWFNVGLSDKPAGDMQKPGSIKVTADSMVQADLEVRPETNPEIAGQRDTGEVAVTQETSVNKDANPVVSVAKYRKLKAVGECGGKVPCNKDYSTDWTANYNSGSDFNTAGARTDIDVYQQPSYKCTSFTELSRCDTCSTNKTNRPNGLSYSGLIEKRPYPLGLSDPCIYSSRTPGVSRNREWHISRRKEDELYQGNNRSARFTTVFNIQEAALIAANVSSNRFTVVPHISQPDHEGYIDRDQHDEGKQAVANSQPGIRLSQIKRVQITVVSISKNQVQCVFEIPGVFIEFVFDRNRFNPEIVGSVLSTMIVKRSTKEEIDKYKIPLTVSCIHCLTSIVQSIKARSLNNSNSASKYSVANSNVFVCDVKLNKKSPSGSQQTTNNGVLDRSGNYLRLGRHASTNQYRQPSLVIGKMNIDKSLTDDTSVMDEYDISSSRGSADSSTQGEGVASVVVGGGGGGSMDPIAFSVPRETEAVSLPIQMVDTSGSARGLDDITCMPMDVHTSLRNTANDGAVNMITSEMSGVVEVKPLDQELFQTTGDEAHSYHTVPVVVPNALSMSEQGHGDVESVCMETLKFISRAATYSAGLIPARNTSTNAAMQPLGNYSPLRVQPLVPPLASKGMSFNEFLNHASPSDSVDRAFQLKPVVVVERDVNPKGTKTTDYRSNLEELDHNLKQALGLNVSRTIGPQSSIKDGQGVSPLSVGPAAPHPVKEAELQSEGSQIDPEMRKTSSPPASLAHLAPSTKGPNAATGGASPGKSTTPIAGGSTVPKAAQHLRPTCKGPLAMEPRADNLEQRPDEQAKSEISSRFTVVPLVDRTSVSVKSELLWTEREHGPCPDTEKVEPLDELAHEGQSASLQARLPSDVTDGAVTGSAISGSSMFNPNVMLNPLPIPQSDPLLSCLFSSQYLPGHVQYSPTPSNMCSFGSYQLFPDDFPLAGTNTDLFGAPFSTDVQSHQDFGLAQYGTRYDVGTSLIGGWPATDANNVEPSWSTDINRLPTTIHSDQTIDTSHCFELPTVELIGNQATQYSMLDSEIVVNSDVGSLVSCQYHARTERTPEFTDEYVPTTFSCEYSSSGFSATEDITSISVGESAERHVDEQSGIPIPVRIVRSEPCRSFASPYRTRRGGRAERRPANIPIVVYGQEKIERNDSEQADEMSTMSQAGMFEDADVGPGLAHSLSLPFCCTRASPVHRQSCPYSFAFGEPRCPSLNAHAPECDSPNALLPIALPNSTGDQIRQIPTYHQAFRRSIHNAPEMRRQRRTRRNRRTPTNTSTNLSTEEDNAMATLAAAVRFEIAKLLDRHYHETSTLINRHYDEIYTFMNNFNEFHQSFLTSDRPYARRALIDTFLSTFYPLTPNPAPDDHTPFCPQHLQPAYPPEATSQATPYYDRGQNDSIASGASANFQNLINSSTAMSWGVRPVFGGCCPSTRGQPAPHFESAGYDGYFGESVDHSRGGGPYFVGCGQGRSAADQMRPGNRASNSCGMRRPNISDHQSNIQAGSPCPGLSEAQQGRCQIGHMLNNFDWNQHLRSLGGPQGHGSTRPEGFSSLRPGDTGGYDGKVHFPHVPR